MNQDGSHLEQHLLSYWGREGRVGWGIIEEFLGLAKEYSWEAVFDAIKQAGIQNKKSLAYVKGVLKGKYPAPKPLPGSPAAELPMLTYLCGECSKVHNANEICPELLKLADRNETAADAQKNVESFLKSQPTTRDR